MSKLNYRVEVKTSNEKKAGTNENVYLKLIFTNGESTPFLLDKGDYDDFEQGDRDYYNITTENKGELIAIEVRMLPEKASTNDVIELWNKAKSEGGLNRSPDWKLDYVEVWCDVKYNQWPYIFDTGGFCLSSARWQ